jgi:hypothetical protein
VNILLYSPGQDTGGQGVRLKALLERHVPGIVVRSAIWKTTYLDYPTDVVISRPREARELFRWADVIHLRHSLRPWTQFGGVKPALLHHHGARFIANHGPIFREADRLGIPQVVSGLEMQQLEPGTAWLPQPHDIAGLAVYRPRRRSSGPLRIVQCPTRQSKGSELVQAAVSRLSERHDIEFDVVQGVSWEECLRRKSRADIFVDQVGPLAYGYGNNSVEAWAMGLPVVSEAPGAGVRDRMLAAWGELPFVDAGEGLETRLEALIVDPMLRDRYAERGLAHARRYHDYPAIAAQLMAYYERSTGAAA